MYNYRFPGLHFVCELSGGAAGRERGRCSENVIALPLQLTVLTILSEGTATNPLLLNPPPPPANPQALLFI